MLLTRQNKCENCTRAAGGVEEVGEIAGRDEKGGRGVKDKNFRLVA